MSVICDKSENIIILSFRQRRNLIDFNGFFFSFHSILNDKNGIMNEYGHSNQSYRPLNVFIAIETPSKTKDLIRLTPKSKRSLRRFISSVLHSPNT